MSKSFLKLKDGMLNFSCRMADCNHSCCGPFASISDKLNNIEGRPFDEIVLTEKDFNALLRSGYLEYVEEGYSQEMKKPYYRMALEPDGTCKAFLDGKCSIHDVKPTLCRAFPFYFDIFSGLCAIQCEGFNDKDYNTPFEDIEPCIDAAREMYEFWIDFYSRKSEENK